jgi:hypothetical protein
MRQLFSLMCQNLSSEDPKSKKKNFSEPPLLTVLVLVSGFGFAFAWMVDGGLPVEVEVQCTVYSSLHVYPLRLTLTPYTRIGIGIDSR